MHSFFLQDKGPVFNRMVQVTRHKTNYTLESTGVKKKLGSGKANITLREHP